jgi:hypothetical protein
MNDLVTPFLAVFLSDALGGSMSEWGAADLTEVGRLRRARLTTTTMTPPCHELIFFLRAACPQAWAGSSNRHRQQRLTAAPAV